MRNEINIIRGQMKKEKLDALLIVTADYHNSEYVNPHFAFRAWATGFTGSAGSAVITQESAVLWVDGRYYLQGEKQLAGSGIEMVRGSEPDALSIEDHLLKVLPEGGRLGIDTRTISYGYGSKLARALSSKKCVLVNCDLAAEVWTDRPVLTPGHVFVLEEKYSGESASSKLSRIRDELKKKKADLFVLSSLSEIAWTLNLRGNDIDYCPMFYAYLTVESDRACLYAFEDAFSSEVRDHLTASGVTLQPYESFFDALPRLAAGQKVLADPKQISYAIGEAIRSAADKTGEVGGKTGEAGGKTGEAAQKTRFIPGDAPTTLMAATKNKTEIENLHRANLADGAAMVQTIYWIKQQAAKKAEGTLSEPFTELSVADYVLARRKEAGALDASFETIAGYGAHGAIVHYEPTAESDIPIEARGFLLVDSGGHYLTGTTDITRTIAVGPLTDAEKEHFTLVLKGTIDLAMAVFPEGTSGANLDVYARMPLWQRGLDFRHGTGHGIGYLLNVHEGPQNIRKNGLAPFVPGMLTSDEPGYYEAGSHGIRTENDILCVPAFESYYGKFYKFETLTLCPIDREAIIPEMLSSEELEWLNGYHAAVYEKLAPMLAPEIAGWLKEVTRPL